MKKTVPPVAEAPALEEELPVRVQEALGELAAAAREGLLALSVGVGLGVLAELMEEEVVGERQPRWSRWGCGLLSCRDRLCELRPREQRRREVLRSVWCCARRWVG
jgi:hypothetical protein